MSHEHELPDDRFVPIHSADLVAAITAETSRFGDLSPHVEAVAEGLDSVIDQETTAFQRRLSRRYERFNPARETLNVEETQDQEAEIEELRDLLDYLLDKANYEHLADRAVESTISIKKSNGIQIKVNPELIRSIDLYVRGRTTAEKRVRTVRHPVKGEVRRVELFRRLAVVFRLRDEDHLNLKLFRDIPTADVEALLPHAEVHMGYWDRIKVFGYGLGALGGLATKGAVVLMEGTLVAGQFMWAGIAAFFGLGLRSVFGYRRAKDVRASQMRHNLYYQNVANNAGVLSSLLTNIAQEELKEVLLAYVVLAADPELASAEELNAAVERWLDERFGVRVDFDGLDAIETLDRLELWDDRKALTVIEPVAAVEKLRAHWGARKSVLYHRQAWQARRGTGRPLVKDSLG